MCAGGHAYRVLHTTTAAAPCDSHLMVGGCGRECACELVGMCLWDVSSYGKLVAHVYLWVVVAHVGCSSACGL